MNIHSLKKRIVSAHRFIREEKKKKIQNRLKIQRYKQGILNLQKKLRLKREENGKTRRKKART